MITLREQLRDPLFRKWFAQPPKWKPFGSTPPWVVYVQREANGPWAKAEFEKWSDAYRFVAKNLKKYYDMSLSHKRHEFRPPVVREQGRRRYHLPEAPGHFWCGYCRRMTRFGYFSRHHAMPKRWWGSMGNERMCSICGVRLEFLRYKRLV